MPRQPGLFGPPPERIQQAMADERIARAAAIGNIPLGGFGGAIAGQLAGQAIGDIAGIQDPRLRQAQTMQDVQQQMLASGLSPGTPEYTQAVTQAFRAAGQEDLAVQAFTLGRQLEEQSLETEGRRLELRGDPGAVPRRARALVLAGADPEFAALIAPDEKAFREQLKALAPKDPPAQIQAYALARQQGYDGSFLDYQKELRRAGASSVKVSVGDKPLSISDLQRIRTASGAPLPPGTTPNQAAEAVATGQAVVLTPEQQAAQTTLANERAKQQTAFGTAAKAIEDMRALTRSLSAADVVTPAQRRRFQAAADRVGKAMAQARNPPGTEASEAAAQAVSRNLGGIAGQVGFGGTDAVLDDLAAEVQRLGGGPRRRRFNPQTGRLE